jgi:hypothetical protein
MELADAPELVVLNKIDATDAETVDALTNEMSGLAVSAAKRIGIGDLLKEIEARLSVLQSAVPQSTGPQSTGPQSTGPQSTGPQSTGSQSTGPQIPEQPVLTKTES